MKASNVEEVGQIRRRRGISMKTIMKEETLLVNFSCQQWNGHLEERI